MSEDRTSLPDLEGLFHPSSVAIVGVSSDTNNQANNWVKTLQELGFEGRLYPVSLSLSEIFGLKAHPNLKDIPDSIDYVIMSVPAQLVPQLVEDCVDKGARFIHIFAAGFSETGEEERIKLEQKIVEIARRGGVRIIGPNCMGMYCPDSHFSWRRDFPREGGAVAVFSQSGWNAADLVNLAAVQGIRFSKVISYGNACDLNETDFLEYFAREPKSKIVAAYLEDVKEGQRFFRAMRRATKIKPVLILKGGNNEAGMRAAASHTGALAGSQAIWDSFFKQSGAIRVGNLDELTDTILAFLYLRIPKGRNVAVIGSGGGPSVQAADACDNAGLVVPPLPTEIREELGTFVPIEGTILYNPVDLPFLMSPKQFQQAIRIVAGWQQTDLVIIHIGIDYPLFVLPNGKRMIEETDEATISAVKEVNKPAAIVLRSSGSPEALETIAVEQGKFAKAGLPLYPSIARAAQAFSNFIQYHEYHAAM